MSLGKLVDLTMSKQSISTRNINLFIDSKSSKNFPLGLKILVAVS